MNRLLASVVIILMAVSFVSAEQHKWGWVKAGNNLATFWDVNTGAADVEINKGKFSAKLYSKDDPNVLDILLQGTIKDGRLKVKEIVQDSDLGNSNYTGTYIKQGTLQTINLSDGFGMIGLTCLPEK